MPPAIPVYDFKQKLNRSSSLPHESSDEEVDSQSEYAKPSESKDGSSKNDTPSSVNRQKNTERVATRKSLKPIGSRSRDVSSAETEANNPYPKQYPLSRQVFDLEKREKEMQDKYKVFENQCHELTSTLERLTKATTKERADHKAKCKALKAANDTMAQQLEEEQAKVKDLHAKNESLNADLAAMSEEKTWLTKMLEEKNYESWIYRCAVAIIYKATPSVRERVSMRKLLYDVLNCLRENYQRERAAREQDQALDQTNSGDRVSEEAAERSESHWDEAERPSASSAVELDSDSDDRPLKDRKAQQKRPRVTEAKDRASGDDSDEDQPLLNVLRKRAKKLKTMSAQERASYAD
ncbi:hypothetical protein V8C42DRAFT_356784 [Trichoderma barbatum]